MDKQKIFIDRQGIGSLMKLIILFKCGHPLWVKSYLKKYNPFSLGKSLYIAYHIDTYKHMYKHTHTHTYRHTHTQTHTHTDTHIYKHADLILTTCTNVNFIRGSFVFAICFDKKHRDIYTIGL